MIRQEVESLTDLRPKSVLIAEDDPGISRMMKLVLEDEGFAVTIARDGAEAIALVGSIKPDVLLLDLRLPVLSGEEVASSIRSLPDGARPKVLITSASSRLKEISEQIGADGFIQKPFELDDLIAATQQALSD